MQQMLATIILYIIGFSAILKIALSQRTQIFVIAMALHFPSKMNKHRTQAILV